MSACTSIFKREVKSYFATPIAYVFLVIFLFFSSFLTFSKGFFESREASMRLFFSNMPLLFLFLVPAISMRLWAEERRSNSIEFLFTLPVTTGQAVLAKFFAAWSVLAIALALTFPMVLTVSYLGKADPGPIATGYLGSVLMAGAYLAIGSFFSALSRNQVIAFILSVVACGAFLYADSPQAMEFVATHISSRLANMLELISFQTRFESIQLGRLQLRDLAFFLLLSSGWLWATIVLLEERKGA
ncbi:ABC transporter permease [bacterium]|nr:ABC transporter permease [bacterium]